MGPKCEEKNIYANSNLARIFILAGLARQIASTIQKQSASSTSFLFCCLCDHSISSLHLAHPSWAGSSIVAYPAPAMRLAFSTADGLNDLINCCTMQLGQNCEVVRSNNCTLQARHNFLSHGRSCKNSGRFCYKIQWDSINLTPHPPTHPILMPHYPT